MSVKIYRKLTGQADSTYQWIATVPDSPTSFLDTGLQPSTSYDYKGVRSEEGKTDSIALFASAVTTGTTSTYVTPSAPNVFNDDNLNRLSFSHSSYPASELETSVNGADPIPYTSVPGYRSEGYIWLGNTARGEGFYRTRVKEGSSRYPSAYTDSPAFNEVAWTETESESTFITSDFNALSWENSLPELGASASYSGTGIVYTDQSTADSPVSLKNALIFKGSGSSTKDRWKITCEVTMNRMSPGAGGIGLGIFGADNGANYSRITAYTVLNGAAGDPYQGQSFLANAALDGSNFGILSSGSNYITSHTNGHIFRLELDFRLGAFTYTCTNLTTGQSSTVSRVTDFAHDAAAPGFRPLPFNNYFGLFLPGGDYTITSFTATTKVPVNAELAIVGDSKMQGYNVGAYANRASAKLAIIRQKAVVNLSGAGDKVGTVKLRLKEIQQQAPKRVVLIVGRNDVFSDTFKTEYQSLVSTIQSYGITVFHGQTMAESGSDFSALRTWIVSTYGSSVIDTYTPTLPYDNPGDGVHISAATAQIVADTLHAYLPVF